VVCAWRPWLHATQLGAMGAARPMGAFSTGVHIDWGRSQWPVHVDCGLSYTTVQATIALCGLWWWWWWRLCVQVVWVQQQVAKKRVKRNIPLQFTDPKWPRMWYLVSTRHFFNHLTQVDSTPSCSLESVVGVSLAAFYTVTGKMVPLCFGL